MPILQNESSAFRQCPSPGNTRATRRYDLTRRTWYLVVYRGEFRRETGATMPAPIIETLFATKCGKRAFVRRWKESFISESIAVRSGSSTRAFVVRPVISNGLYGHLNNHLAHPPSLNSLSLLFSLSRRLFSESRVALSGRACHALTTRRQDTTTAPLLSIFLPLRPAEHAAVTIICLRPTCASSSSRELRNLRAIGAKDVSGRLVSFSFSPFFESTKRREREREIESREIFPSGVAKSMPRKRQFSSRT